MILLNALLKVIDYGFVLLVDERMALLDSASKNSQVKLVKPSVKDRFSAELLLYKSVGPEDVVLCFGNLPPLFKLRGYTVVFVQNRYLIEDVSLSGFPFMVNESSVAIEAIVETTDRTGVEMEALTACSVAALTMYDMCKSADKSMVIADLALWEKSGGRSGDYQLTE